MRPRPAPTLALTVAIVLALVLGGTAPAGAATPVAGTFTFPGSPPLTVPMAPGSCPPGTVNLVAIGGTVDITTFSVTRAFLYGSPHVVEITRLSSTPGPLSGGTFANARVMLELRIFTAPSGGCVKESLVCGWHVGMRYTGPFPIAPPPGTITGNSYTDVLPTPVCAAPFTAFIGLPPGSVTSTISLV